MIVAGKCLRSQLELKAWISSEVGEGKIPVNIIPVLRFDNRKLSLWPPLPRLTLGTDAISVTDEILNARLTKMADIWVMTGAKMQMATIFIDIKDHELRARISVDDVPGLRELLAASE